MAPPHDIAGWGPIRSLLCLFPLLIFVPWFAVRGLYGDPPSFLVLPSIAHFLFDVALPEPVSVL